MTDINGTMRIAELETDNERLRRLLDQRGAPAELRHRLHSTLAMLRVIIRRSAETRRDLDTYIGHLEDRLDALVRAQVAADGRGSVDLHSLLADELFHYGAKEGEQLLISGPLIDLQPRAGQVLALAIHELAVNALEYGTLGASIGRIEIAWSVTSEGEDSLLTFTWKESGLLKVSKGLHEGFGTEVLTRTIPYELKATTLLEFETDGVRCTFRFPLSERTGSLGKL